MHQDQTRKSEELWDRCLSTLKATWLKQRQSDAWSRLFERNTQGYEVLLAGPSSRSAVRQAWQLNGFISSYRFGAGGALERALEGGGADEVSELVERRILVGNAVLEDTGIFVGRYPEGLLQWLLLVSLGREEDWLEWGRFLFEDRAGSAIDLDYTGLALDQYCQFLWSCLAGRKHVGKLVGQSHYSGLIGAWDRGPDLVGELWSVLDGHLMDVRKLDGAEVYYMSPFCLCPVEVLAAIRLIGSEEMISRISGHPLYRNSVVAAVMESKASTEDGLALRDWLKGSPA